MPIQYSRRLAFLIAAFLTAGALAVPAIAANRNAPDLPGLFGIVGAIMNAGVADEARRAWQKRPAADYDCLATQGSTAEQFASHGAGPMDQRVRRILSQCSQESPMAPTLSAFAGLSPTPVAPSYALSNGPTHPDYVVDGLALGAAVYPDSPIYKAYRCQPSEQFASFTWCSIKHAKMGKFGPYASIVTFLHSPENAAIYINQEVTPAFFLPDDVDREIRRLSAHFGQEARVLYGEPRPGAEHSVVAVWGYTTLTPLDEGTMDALRRGDTISAGLLVDYLGSATRSARAGLPVFHMSDGAGFVWSANFDEAGKGSLRITAVNPGALPIAQAKTPKVAISPTMEATTASPVPTAVPNADEQARRDRQQAERLEKIIVAAKTQVVDAAQFIRDHQQNPQLLDYIAQIADLSAAIESGDSEQIERKSTELSARLNRDKDYQQFLASVSEQQKQDAAKNLFDAIQRAQQQRAFLVDFVSKNPLATDTGKFVSLIKQLDPLLLKPELTSLQMLVGKLDLAIREANLQTAFTATHVKALASSPSTSQIAQTTLAPEDTVIPTTPENRFLMEGDLSDVILLYNVDAPHIAKNLRNDFVFANNIADVCLFGVNPEDVAISVAKIVASFGASPPANFGSRICKTDTLSSFDIVAMQRGAFLKASRIEALSVIKAIQNASLKQMMVVPANELRAQTDAERHRLAEITATIAAGAPDGYGMLILNTGAPNLCLIANEKVGGHKQMLVGALSTIRHDMKTSPTISRTTLDDAFVSAQKRQCGALYASAADLKTLSKALSTNGIDYTVSSLWLLPSEIEKADADVAERNRIAAEDSVQRTQKADDEARLRSQRANDLNATQASQQSALRAKYEGAAKAAVAVMIAEITTWTRNPTGPIGSTYPAYSAWLGKLLSDHWEVIAINGDLHDFGNSDFKGRLLETSFARISLRLKNSMLGDYKDGCFIIGRINDIEFSVIREPISASCGDEGAIKVWQTGHGFKSEWIVTN